MVHIVGLGTNSTQMERSEGEMKPHLDHSLYQTTLRSGREEGYFKNIFHKIGSIFSYIWESIKTFFNTVFFCISGRMKVDKKVSLKELTELRDTLRSYREAFLLKREDRNALENWWKEAFSQLSPEGQKLLIMKDMEGMARNKYSSDEEIHKHTKDLYANEQQRQNSFDYVQNLKCANDSTGKIWDPIHDDQVPLLLREVIEDLEKKIASLQPEVKAS